MADKNSLDAFLKATFTPEFLKECNVEYHKAETDGLKHRIDELEKQVIDLCAQNADLRCCGNCYHYDAECDPICARLNEQRTGDSLCALWVGMKVVE